MSYRLCRALVIAAVVVSLPFVNADDVMLVARGQSMGTTYSVKVFEPPEAFPNDWRLAIDRKLRELTDLMSTYVESSQISRFNQSTSLDWQPCSASLVTVVKKSLELSQLSSGRFDITVMPLVKAWGFGPGKKLSEPPGDADLQVLRAQVGFQQLAVRTNPPALKKAIPELTIDLNAIAPGYAVDAIVSLLQGFGAKNLFVELGGEIRVTGDKAGRPWMVGIQQPDVAGTVVAVAYPFCDSAIATSGDYRNYFEHEGKRYSHTIDPLTARPIEHHLASVTVVADDCMTADGLATLLNVLGDVEGYKFAKQNQIDTLMLVREGNGTIVRKATGRFASIP